MVSEIAAARRKYLHVGGEPKNICKSNISCLILLKSIISTIEIRKHLIEMIQETENESILYEINRLLVIELEAESIYELNEHQINAINEARLQYKNGQIIENDQANKEIEEWLGK